MVWMDGRNNNYDIYGYNLQSEKEFQITTDPSSQSNPVIYENIVVWEDERNGNKDIYGYNLSTQEEFQITTDEKDQSDPVIYGDIVVWIDYRNVNADIYGYSLSTKEEFEITTNTYEQNNLAIYKNIVIWEDSRSGNGDIYGYDLSTRREFQITTGTGSEWSPAIYGDIVVWAEVRNYSYGIYGYNLSTREELQIKTNIHEQPETTIYGYIVIWTDYRNHNWNIYGCNLLNVLEEGPIPSYKQFYKNASNWLYENEDLIYVLSFFFEIGAILILSIYFFRDYIIHRRRASLVWGIGLLLSIRLIHVYAANIIEGISGSLIEDLNVSLQVGVWILLMMVAFGMILLYYGTSLLIFKPGSFFREKMSIFVFFVYFLFISWYAIRANFRIPFIVNIWFQIGPLLMAPAYLMIATLFYSFSHKSDSSLPIKGISFILSVGSLLLAISSVLMGWDMYLPMPSGFSIFITHVLSSMAWILIIYAMVIRKATVLMQKTDLMLICPRCKNRVQEVWIVCPYCEAKLR